MEHWYVVQTHPSGEFKAQANLARQGFEAYLPAYMKKRRHARRVDWVRQPLFPRYLFVRLDLLEMQWGVIKSTYGVSRIICQDGQPTALPDGVIAGIAAQEDDAGCVVLNRVSEFTPGQAVEIGEGPLADVTAIFDCIDDKDRVIVLMDIMGRKVRARVPLEALRAAG